MKQVFLILSEDNDLLKRAKEEANLLLHNYENRPVKNIGDRSYENMLHIMKMVIEASEVLSKNTFANGINGIILSYLEKLFDSNVPLSPLTLLSDEFESESIYNFRGIPVYKNTRYNHILKLANGEILHEASFKIKAINTYDDSLGRQIENIIVGYDRNTQVYISKGGVISDEYIRRTFIRKDIVDQHNYTVRPQVVIPVTAIDMGHSFIYSVDYREPKLKALREFYHVEDEIEPNCPFKGLDIRKYEKFDKKAKEKA